MYTKRDSAMSADLEYISRCDSLSLSDSRRNQRRFVVISGIYPCSQLYLRLLLSVCQLYRPFLGQLGHLPLPFIQVEKAGDVVAIHTPEKLKCG